MQEDKGKMKRYKIAVSASSCKNGPAKDLKQIWLDNEQLSQIYKWIDSLGRFEYTLKTGTAVDAMTITLDFSGQGNASANKSDQQSIQTFTEKFFSTRQCFGRITK
jgi:hypothetical protein